MAARTVDALVVGAGPAGLTAAVALRRAGADVLVVDRAAAGANTSRAAVVHARTLEALEPLDLPRRLLAEGRVVPVFTLRDRRRRLARVDFGGLPTRYPYTLMIPQFRTEQMLLERLAELGGAVLRPAGVEALDLGEDAVTATLADGGLVRARYVVGADGMRSTVRAAAGIDFPGGSYEQSFVLADVHMTWPLPEDEVQLFLSPAGLVVVAPLPDGLHRIVATVDDAPAAPGQPDVQSLLDARGPGAAQVRDVLWASRFRVHHRVAATFRRGRVLLAGDAAHVHSPAGGQGMNLGIRDAVDAGTTLAAALTGAATGDLDGHLDGYELRRRPAALEVVALTDRATRLATLRPPSARVARNTALRLVGRVPAARRAVAMRLAGLRPAGAREPTQTSQMWHTCVRTAPWRCPSDST